MTNTQQSFGEDSTQSNSIAKTHDKSNKSLLVLITTISFILLIVLMIFSGNQSALALDESKLLVTQHAKVEVMSINIESSYVKPRLVYGQIEPLQQSEIGFELNGTLEQLNVLEGQYVKKGQILAVLDTARLNARENELKSALKSAKANANIANISAKRIAQLVSKKLEPQQALDEVQAQVDAANAMSAEAQARLDSLSVELSKSSLVAPYDGQIVRQYIDVGTVINPNAAVFSIIANDDLEVRFGLPEQTAFGLKPTQTHILDVRGNKFSAQVKSVASQRNLATRTIDAVFTIDASSISTQLKAVILSGDLVSLSVDIPMQAQGAWVPIGALAAGVRGMWTLYVVDQDNTIQTRLVSITYANETRAFVTGAVNQNEQVVISGIHRLSPLQQVDNVVEVDTQLVYARTSLAK
jgi:RND family efflux transporter MFP subunit